MKNVAGYIIALAVGVVSTNIYHACENDKVYVVRANKVFHKTSTCDKIDGFDREILDEFGEVVGSEKIAESEVYGDAKFIMCSYCFSNLELESRENYLHNINNVP